jgi:hypothetical protein
MRSLALLLAIGITALASPAIATATQPLPQTPDAGVWVPNSTVSALTTHGGTTYIGGAFDYVGPPTGPVATLDADGHAAPLGPITGVVSATAVDPAGGIYLGGELRMPDSAPVQIVHVRADGTIDPGFAAPKLTGDFAGVRTLLLSGTTLYVGGRFSKAGATDRTGVAALDATDGHLLPFSVNLTGGGFSGTEVDALALQAGYLYVGGSFDQANGTPCANLIDVNLASHQIFQGLCSFSPNGPVNELALRDGMLYIGGWYSALGGSPGGNLRRIATDKDVADGYWLPAPDGPVTALAVDASTVYFGGSFGDVGGKSRSHAAAVSTADASVLPWDPAPSGRLWEKNDTMVESLLLSGGHVYAGGNFTAIGGRGRTDLAALDPVTGAATGWNPSAGGMIYALAADAGGKVVAAGSLNSFGGVIRRRLAALGPDGSATAWNPGADDTVSAIAVSPDGATVYAGGEFTQVGGAPRARLAAISAAGGGATSFDPAPDNRVWQVLPAPDGATLYVAGNFKTIGQSSAADRPYLAALSTTTGDPSGWRPAPDGDVSALAAAPDWSVIYAGGSFTHVGSQQPQPARSHLAAVNRSGATATGWAPAVGGGWLGSLLALPSRIYVGGTFATLAGAPRIGMGAVDATGGLLPWSPGFAGGSQAHAFALGAKDRVIVGGQIYAGGWRVLAETDAATGAPTSWAPAVFDGNVQELAVAGRQLWAAGTFKAAGGRGNLVRFTRPADPAPPAPGGGTPGGGTPGGGTQPPPPPPAGDTTAPELGTVTLSRKRFRVARGATALSAAARAGTTLRFTLSEAARMRIALRRVRAGHVKRVGALLRSEPAGPGRIAFSGRLGTRALRPGRYRMRITATDRAGNRSQPAVVVRFRILARH